MTATEWECVHDGRIAGRVQGSVTDRLVVPGGWLYRTVVYSTGEVVVAMVFVPAEQITEVRRVIVRNDK